MVKAAIIGFGRIGRAIFRINQSKKFCDFVVINDLNPDIQNMAYLLKYDSTYGRFGGSITVEDPYIVTNGSKARIFHARNIMNLPWEELGVDLVIDASGTHDNVLEAHNLIKRGVKKVIITHSHERVDHTIVFGANEETYQPTQHHVISSSICDAVAVAPVLRELDNAIGVQTGFLTTLHPWLAYQNLLDGPSVSWSVPGTLYPHYAIGRASPGSLIPKPTSAVEATEKVLSTLKGAIQCMSFRIPTQTVGAANLYLTLKRETSLDEITRLFESAEARQKWTIVRNNREPLVSVDFAQTEHSAIIDHRWTTLSDGKHLYLVLWYDNEWGYSSRVLDLAHYVSNDS